MRQQTRREFMKAAVAAGVATSMFPESGSAAATNRRRPNVIILFIDDLGYGDLGCFGNKRIPTPNIDALAARGVRCTMSYITNPPCSPSRCALMTGMYAQRFGKSGMARGMPIPEDHPTLAEFMRDAGYVTGHVGKWDVGAKGQGPHERGFMEVARSAPINSHYECRLEDGTIVYRTDLDGDHMVEFVERNRNKPFFLYFSPFAVHSPHTTTPARYRERVSGGGSQYEGAVVALDEQVGRLMATLSKHGLEEDTLILLTGDNGPHEDVGGSSEPYAGGKGDGTQYEGWVHTPTVASWPKVLPAGRTYDGLMCTLDFYATCAAVAGRPLPARCDGRDLLPFLTGDNKSDAHEYLFWHNADPTDEPHRNLYAVRWKNWRLIKRQGKWCLYDLETDKKETVDLAAKHPDVVAAMSSRYDAFVATLPPVKPTADYKGKGGGQGVPGWGWQIGNGGQAKLK